MPDVLETAPPRRWVAPQPRLARVRGVEIFAAGVHDDYDYTPAGLSEIVRNFGLLSVGPKALYRVPIVLGHESDQDLLENTGYPAAGWIDNVHQEGDILVCDFVDVPLLVAKLINQRAYRRVSSEVYDDFQYEGQSYGLALRRVAILGAMIPEVKGLADIPMAEFAAFADAQRFHRAFTEPRLFRAFALKPDFGGGGRRKPNNNRFVTDAGKTVYLYGTRREAAIKAAGGGETSAATNPPAVPADHPDKLKAEFDQVNRHVGQVFHDVVKGASQADLRHWESLDPQQRASDTGYMATEFRRLFGPDSEWQAAQNKLMAARQKFDAAAARTAQSSRQRGSKSPARKHAESDPQQRKAVAMDTAQMRDALIGMGIPQEVADGMDDAAVTAVYNAMQAKAAVPPAEAAPAATLPNPEVTALAEDKPEDAPAETPAEEKKDDVTMAAETCRTFSEKDVSEIVKREVKAALAGSQQDLEAVRRMTRQQVASQKRETIRAFCEEMKAEGKVLQSQLDDSDGQPTLIDRLMRADATNVVRVFSEGGKRVTKTELDLQMDEIRNGPAVAYFGERMHQPLGKGGKTGDDAEVAKLRRHYRRFSEGYRKNGQTEDAMVRAFTAERTKRRPGLTVEEYTGMAN